MLPENARLLEDYFAVRRIADKTKLTVRNALLSWERETHIALAEARVNDVKKWYKKVGKLKASTITMWTIRLRMLSRFTLTNKGVKANLAKIRSDDLWAPVPLRDLVREDKRLSNNRDNLISEDELHKLLSTASNARLKAFLAVLYDSGCRKGELKTLRIRDVSFGDVYTEIRVQGKTGERTISLADSVPYLREWLQVHPHRRPEEFLFLSYRGRPLDDDYPNSSLNDLCMKAGIRHIHPHQLRHTRLTELANRGVGEFAMKSYAGWAVNSTMPARYIKLTGMSHKNAILEAQGIEVPKQDKPKRMMSLGTCPKCDRAISGSALFCSNCGYILDESLRADEKEVKRLSGEELDAMREFLKTMGFKP